VSLRETEWSPRGLDSIARRLGMVDLMVLVRAGSAV